MFLSRGRTRGVARNAVIVAIRDNKYRYFFVSLSRLNENCANPVSILCQDISHRAVANWNFCDTLAFSSCLCRLMSSLLTRVSGGEALKRGHLTCPPPPPRSDPMLFTHEHDWVVVTEHHIICCSLYLLRLLAFGYWSALYPFPHLENNLQGPMPVASGSYHHNASSIVLY